MLRTQTKLREVLDFQSREIINNVYTYFKSVPQESDIVLPDKHVVLLVSEATGVSECNVWRIIRENKKLINAESKCKSNGDKQLVMDVAALENENEETCVSVEDRHEAGHFTSQDPSSLELYAKESAFLQIKEECTDFVDVGQSPAELEMEGLPFPKVKEEPVEIAPVDSHELELKKEKSEFLTIKCESVPECLEEEANRMEDENSLVEEGKTSLAKRGAYGKWTTEQLSLAIAAYLSGDYGLNQCSRIYRIPKHTLKRHAENKNVEANGDVKKFGRSRTFSSDIETELEKHILELVESTFVVRPIDVRKIAFQIANKNGIPHTFNAKQQMAGTNWYYKFMERHPRLLSVIKTKGLKKKDNCVDT